MTVAPEAGQVTFEVLDAAGFAEAIDALGELLADAVESGASVNFVLPFSAADGRTWWTARQADVAAGRMLPIVARVDGVVVGCAALVLAGNPNSPHRAEVVKVLVHRRARGRGIGSGLMAAIEDLARRHGRWMLQLDTHSGSDAERLYRRLGWQEFGVVPNHSLGADGREFLAATFFWKDLREDGPA